MHRIDKHKLIRALCAVGLFPNENEARSFVLENVSALEEPGLIFCASAKAKVSDLVIKNVVEKTISEEEITKIFVTKRINKPFVPKVIGNLQKKKGRF